MLTKDELEFGYQVDFDSWQCSPKPMTRTMYLLVSGWFWFLTMLPQIKWQWQCIFQRSGDNFRTELSASPPEHTFGKTQHPGWYLTLSDSVGHNHQNQTWICFLQFILCYVTAIATSRSGRTSCHWCWLGWSFIFLLVYCFVFYFFYCRWPFITPSGTTSILPPLVRSNVRSGWNNQNHNHIHHHHPCHHHPLRPQPSSIETGLTNTWTVKTLPSTWWSPTRQGSLRSRFHKKYEFWAKTPLEDQFVIRLGQRKNKLTKQPTELTATGGSTEEVQMLNSKLWKCGDALQCCRCVHNF